ncbi:protein of unknown function [Bosea lupini]|uniref:DUF4260 domain-containing protein n=1 Tax=Bosea lupini TaxID=1036779 RepID=A0A1H7WIZ7_9HYPH|nr:DUF4260 domain-containing protein [Bosea lupini]SEM21461.1 protein of unknown function [Bosea lupini]
MNQTSYNSSIEPGGEHPAVTGTVALILRSEGGVALISAVIAYQAIGGSWTLFAVLFFTPDVSMLGYLANRRIGAWGYNLAHNYVAPAALGLLGWAMALPMFYGMALIWVGHIGFDRLVGYGLKYPAAFGATHLGWKGGRYR